jgi:hypothetical protein
MLRLRPTPEAVAALSDKAATDLALLSPGIHVHLIISYTPYSFKYTLFIYIRLIHTHLTFCEYIHIYIRLGYIHMYEGVNLLSKRSLTRPPPTSPSSPRVSIFVYNFWYIHIHISYPCCYMHLVYIGIYA